jgi:hypothetical protein
MRPCLLAFVGCLITSCGAARPSTETSPSAVPPDRWAGACADASECVLILTEPGECCEPGEWIAVHRAFEQEATREVGFIAEEAPRAAPTCTDSCVPPAYPAAICEGGRCVAR